MEEKLKQPRQRMLIGICILVVVLLALAVLFVPMNVRNVRNAAARTQALNNLRNVSIALLIYTADHGHLPPAQTFDSDNRPLHSWRTLLLPYLDQQALFDSLDLTKAWDDPVNQHAWEKMPEVYGTPSYDLGAGMTALSVPVGKDYCFQTRESTDTFDITRLNSEVILLTQVSQQAVVHWMEPKDTAVEYLRARKSFGRPFYGDEILIGLADGSVKVVSLDIDDRVLASMLSTSESVSDVDF